MERPRHDQMIGIVDSVCSSESMAAIRQGFANVYAGGSDAEPGAPAACDVTALGRAASRSFGHVLKASICKVLKASRRHRAPLLRRVGLVVTGRT